MTSTSFKIIRFTGFGFGFWIVFFLVFQMDLAGSIEDGVITSFGYLLLFGFLDGYLSRESTLHTF